MEVGKPLEIASLFKEGDLVDVAGKSIGKGFQGRLRVGRGRRSATPSGTFDRGAC